MRTIFDYDTYSLCQTESPAWSPEYLQRFKSTFVDRHMPGKELLTDDVHSKPRRIRKQVTGPAENFYFANEINGIRVFRKGRAPLLGDSKNKQQQQDEVFLGLPHYRRSKVTVLGPQPPASIRTVLAYQGCVYPVDDKQQLWPTKGRAKPTYTPPEQREQQRNFSRKLVSGRSHADHGMFFGWDPDAESTSLAQPAGQQLDKQPPSGRRAMPQHNRSNIILG